MHSKDKIVEPEILQIFIKLEEELWQASTRFDDNYMSNIFAPDFFEFGRSGRRYKRDDMFLGSQNLPAINAEMPLYNFSARYLTDDVVQTTYISKVIYGDVVEYANRSSIWTRASTDWRLRFHQGTPTEGKSTYT